MADDTTSVVDQLRMRLLGWPGADRSRDEAAPAGSHSLVDRAADGTDPESRTEEQRAAEKQAKAVCLRLLTDCARPRAGLAKALRKRGFDDDVIDRVLDRFTEVGLIDDQAYADAYARSKHQERGLASSAVAAELRSRGGGPRDHL